MAEASPGEIRKARLSNSVKFCRVPHSIATVEELAALSLSLGNDETVSRHVAMTRSRACVEQALPGAVQAVPDIAATTLEWLVVESSVQEGATHSR